MRAALVTGMYWYVRVFVLMREPGISPNNLSSSRVAQIGVEICSCSWSGVERGTVALRERTASTIGWRVALSSSREREILLIGMLKGHEGTDNSGGHALTVISSSPGPSALQHYKEGKPSFYRPGPPHPTMSVIKGPGPGLGVLV